VNTPRQSNKPHGTWANASLRNLRRDVKLHIDYLCKAKSVNKGIPEKVARQAGYAWRAQSLNIKFEMFEVRSLDEYKCQKALAACGPYVHRFQKNKAIQQRKDQKKRGQVTA
jgi:hypothetical protein